MEFLQQLGLQQQNEGVSTGTKWLITTGAPIESFSPVDGKTKGHITEIEFFIAVIRPHRVAGQLVNQR